MPWIWDEFAYGSRLAWVRTKDILGFQRSGTDRSFYIAQLVRKLRRGELGRNISITAAGKRDGAGAQAQAVISAIAFADAFGLDYVHSPFRYVCHPEGPVAQWTESWEKTFNFGQGHVQVETCGRPVIPLGDFLKDRSLRNKDCVVQLIHYQHWTNYNPSAYVSVAPIATRYADRVTGELWQFISAAATYRQRGPLKRTLRRTLRSPPHFIGSWHFFGREARRHRSEFFHKVRRRTSRSLLRSDPNFISISRQYGLSTSWSKPTFLSWQEAHSASWPASCQRESSFTNPSRNAHCRIGSSAMQTVASTTKLSAIS